MILQLMWFISAYTQKLHKTNGQIKDTTVQWMHYMQTWNKLKPSVYLKSVLY